MGKCSAGVFLFSLNKRIFHSFTEHQGLSLNLPNLTLFLRWPSSDTLVWKKHWQKNQKVIKMFETARDCIRSYFLPTREWKYSKSFPYSSKHPFLFGLCLTLVFFITTAGLVFWWAITMTLHLAFHLGLAFSHSTQLWALCPCWLLPTQCFQLFQESEVVLPCPGFHCQDR